LCASLGWVDEIVVVDDMSVDGTADVAKRYGAKILSHPFKDFSSQFNLGLGLATSDWILSLDADEEIPSESAVSFMNVIQNAGADIGGFRILRKHIVLGKWLRHAQQYGKKVGFFDISKRRKGFKPGEYMGGAVKLFRKTGSVFQNTVHQEIAVPGNIVQLQADVNHYTAETVRMLFDKLNFSTTLFAQEIYSQNPIPPKNYWKLVLFHPIENFFYSYIRKKGFLDGIPGLIRCIADAIYEFFKYVKLYDYYYLGKNGGVCPNRDEKNNVGATRG
jgi:glycosyltransferase involved in cell wall biosynthesis